MALAKLREVENRERGGQWATPAAVIGPVSCRGERAMALCEAMLDIAAELFNVSGRELRSPCRSSVAVSRVRQIAMYVAHVILQLNMTEIGRGFGRDRTTVVHACHLIEDLRDDGDFDQIVGVVERIAARQLRGEGGFNDG